MVILLEEKTIEFGGVATGRQKAQLHAMTAGIINISIGIPAALPVAAKIGINKVAVAVFDVTSVKNDTLKPIKNTNSHNGKSVNPAKALPKISLRPLAITPDAIQIPPANNNKIPQGILIACSQVSRRSPLPFEIMNMATTPASAIVESPTPVTANQPVQPPKGSVRNTHSNTTLANTAKTRLSWVLMASCSGSFNGELRLTPRVSHQPIKGKPKITSGKPMLIQRVKPKLSPV